jgi:hypothetical protein
MDDSNMDANKAFTILGLDRSASSADINKKFKSMLRDSHPDGEKGDHDDMVELNEARAVALKNNFESGQIIPIEQFQEIMVLSQLKTFELQNISKRVEESKKEFSKQATNKLKSYKKVSTVLTAIFAGVLFLGKEVPKDFFHETIPHTILLEMDGDREKKILMEAELKDRNADISRFWKSNLLMLSVFSGFGIWYFKRRIERAESLLKDLEVNISTRSLMHRFLRKLLKHKYEQSWSLDELVEEIAIWPKELDQFRGLINEIGDFNLAMFLIDRSQELNLLKTDELMIDGELIEKYSIVNS